MAQLLLRLPASNQIDLMYAARLGDNISGWQDGGKTFRMPELDLETVSIQQLDFF